MVGYPALHGWNMPGRMAPAQAVLGGDRPSRSAVCTRYASLPHPRCGAGDLLDYACCSSLHAPALGIQGARMVSKRFAPYNSTSRRKQKEPASRIASQRNMAQALRLRLLAWDIHDCLGVAGLAVYRKVFNLRGRKDAHDALPITYRANKPSPDYLYFITCGNICQCVFLGFHPFITYYSKVNIHSQGRKLNKSLRSLA